MDRDEILKGLKETVIYFAICCYSEDSEQMEKVTRMATCVNEAIKLIEGQE